MLSNFNPATRFLFNTNDPFAPQSTFSYKKKAGLGRVFLGKTHTLTIKVGAETKVMSNIQQWKLTKLPSNRCQG